jgi:hypothetical protein
MDIVLTTNGIYTLADVIIVDSTCADLILWIIYSLEVAAMIVV